MNNACRISDSRAVDVSGTQIRAHRARLQSSSSVAGLGLPRRSNPAAAAVKARGGGCVPAVSVAWRTARLDAVAMACLLIAIPLQAAHLITDRGTRIEAELITYTSRNRQYEIRTAEGATTVQDASKIIDVVVPQPPGMSGALKMVDDASAHEKLVPALETVVQQYRGLRWDVQAGYALMQIYIKQGRAKEAISLAEAITKHSHPRWIPVAFHRQVLDALVQDNQITRVAGKAEKMIQTGHAPTMAVGYLAQGDILLQKGEFKEALLNGYFRIIVLYSGVRSVQPEAMAKAVKCLENIRDARADKIRQMLFSRYPNSKWARQLGG